MFGFKDVFSLFDVESKGGMESNGRTNRTLQLIDYIDTYIEILVE